MAEQADGDQLIQKLTDMVSDIQVKDVKTIKLRQNFQSLNLAGIIGLLWSGFIPPIFSQNTLMSYHLFHDKTSTTSVFPSSSNSTYQNTYYTPEGFYGSGYAANNPTVTQTGVLIEHNKWIVSDGEHEIIDFGIIPALSNMFGIWIYYITGNLSTFVNIDFNFASQLGSYKMTTYFSGADQKITITHDAYSYNFGKFYPGWNFILFGSNYYYFKYNIGNSSTGYEAAWPLSPSFGGSYANPFGIRKIGGYDCSDTTVKYIVHSLSLYAGFSSYNLTNTYSIIGAPNSYYGTSPAGGDNIVDYNENGDDGNIVNGDGGTSGGNVQAYYQGTGFPSVGGDLGGDGRNIQNTVSGYGDDGNTVNGDGGSSTCEVESGYSGTGGTSTSADSCSQIGGDGKIMATRPSSTYGDDGNSINGDGGTATGVVEIGYSGTGGSTTTADTCSDKCGDGKLVTSRAPSTYCDDGNKVNEDGGSSTCSTETGYTGTGATSTLADNGRDTGGDGKLVGTRPSNYGDDGNTINGDGGSSSCVVETGYSGNGATLSSADSCTDIGGDGRLYSTRSPSTYCDDGNNVNGDGCSSSGATESGYVCSGASSTQSDTGNDIGGDGKLVGTRPLNYGDDGNTVNGDGGSASGVIESGYTGSGATTSSADVGGDICGDGKLAGTRPLNYGDDGNILNGDGGSFACAVETGYSGNGATSSSADFCTDIGGDGYLYSFRLPSTYCDDGNSVNGDGCSSSGVTESGYVCSGGSITQSDTGNDIGGDGIVSYRSTSSYCDDGNFVNGDGGDSNGMTEDGYTGSGGSTSSSDTGETQLVGESGSYLSDDKTECVIEVSASATAVTGSLAAVTGSTNIISSFSGASSTQSIFTSIHQIQLILLVILFGVYLPSQVQSFIKSLNTALLAFDIPNLKIFDFMTPLFDKFDYQQNDENLKVIGLNSGSTFINILSTILALLIICMVHLVVLIFFLKIRRNPDRNWRTKLTSKLFKSMTFGAYIRLMIEAFLILGLSGLSELNRLNHNDSVHKRSLIFNGVVILFIVIFLTTVLVNFIKKTSKDYFNSETKSGVLPRFYTFALLSRLTLFSIILITIDNKFSKLKVLMINYLQLGHYIYIIWTRPFKAAKDNVIELTNEGFYTFIVGVFLYGNDEDKWSDIFTNVYLYIILFNLLVIGIISMGFMIVGGLKSLFKKKKVNPKINVRTIQENNTEDANFDNRSQTQVRLNINEESKFSNLQSPETDLKLSDIGSPH